MSLKEAMKTIIIILAIVLSAPAYACVAADPPGDSNPGNDHDGPDYGSEGVSPEGENPDSEYQQYRDCDLIINEGQCIKYIRPGLLTIDGKPFYYKAE